jgi:hypothetical protein
MTESKTDPGVPGPPIPAPGGWRCSFYEITEAMIVYGGGFVSQLGRLLLLADDDNKRRLLAAFPEYLHQYDELAALKADREAR